MMTDLSLYGATPGGAFDDSTEPIPAPAAKRFEYVRLGEQTLLPVPVAGPAPDQSLMRLPYVNPDSYNDKPVLLVARIKLFEPFRPFPDRTHALPRDVVFDAYLVGANSTGEYALLDAVAFGGNVLAPIPVRQGRFRVEQWYEGADLAASLENAPHFREKVFAGVPETFYLPREKRSPRAQ